MAPGSLAVDDGADWRSTNSFDVSWVNPVDSGSPVASAHYELCPVDGSGCLGEQTTAGTDISHLAGISVPSPGAWALRVWLQDAVGNVDPTHAAEVTLRFGTAPTDPANPTAPSTTDSSADPTPSPALSDPLSPPSLNPTTTSPTPTSTTARLDPRLRLTSARLTRGRLVIRGRAATTATGRLSLAIRLRANRSLHRRATIRGGRFSVVIPTRQRTRPRSVLARFAGSPTFRPATATLRLPR